MFVKIKEVLFNLDNVVYVWQEIKKVEWHTENGIEVRPRYFIHIRHINDSNSLEFDTEEELNEVMDMLDRELKPITK